MAVNTRMRRLGEKVRSILEAFGAGVPFVYEAEKDQEHKHRRRVVWIASDGRIAQPDTAGQQENTLSATPRKVDSLGVLRERVLITCAAESRQVCEHLVNNMIVALTRAGMKIQDFDGYQWPTQVAANAGNTIREHICTIVCYPRFPIPNDITPLSVEDYLANSGGLLTPCTGHSTSTEYADVEQEVPYNLGYTVTKPVLVDP